MSKYSKQTTSQDNVLAADLRAVFNNGREWGTTGSSLAAVSDLDDLSTATATTAQIATKVNTILALLRNLNA